MAEGITGVAQVTKARRLFVDSAIYTQEFKQLAALTVDHKNLPDGQGPTWNEPYWPTLVASALQDGVEIGAPQQITDASTVITPQEVGADILFTRKMANVISENFSVVAGRLLGNAIARKKDIDIILQLQTATAPALGAAAATLTVGMIGAAVSIIEVGQNGTARQGALASGDPAPAPYHFMTHPYSRYDLASQLSGLGYQGPGGIAPINLAAVAGYTPPTGATYPSNAAATLSFGGQALSAEQMQIIGSHFLHQEVMGATVCFDGNVPGAGAAGGNTGTSICYARDSAVLVEFRQLDVDQEWNIRRRAWEWVATEDYGVGTRADPWQQKVNTDLTLPAA